MPRAAPGLSTGALGTQEEVDSRWRRQADAVDVLIAHVSGESIAVQAQSSKERWPMPRCVASVVKRPMFLLFHRGRGVDLTCGDPAKNGSRTNHDGALPERER